MAWPKPSVTCEAPSTLWPCILPAHYAAASRTRADVAATDAFPVDLGVGEPRAKIDIPFASPALLCHESSAAPALLPGRTMSGRACGRAVPAEYFEGASARASGNVGGEVGG